MDYAEVSKHNSRDSCWVILYDHVYDVTEFLPSHPGGSQIILRLAGKDATQEYDPVHPPGTLEENLPASANLGKIDTSTLPKDEALPEPSDSKAAKGPPPLDTLLNLQDIENAATAIIPHRAWAYYYSAGDDLISKGLNNSVYRQILLRPRVFIDVTKCDTSTSLLSHRVGVPLFIAPAAMARLAHPDGEKGIADACAAFGAPQIISNNSSLNPEQIVEGAGKDQVFGWQIYVQADRRKSEKMLARIARLPQIKFVVLTLDAPVPGKREHDERIKEGGSAGTQAAVQQDAESSSSAGSAGIGQALFAGTAADLTWATTLPWLARHTSLPIVLKGITTHEDAYMASIYPGRVRGIILSNHGGRAADTAPPAVHTLLEIQKYCPEVFKRIEVYIDGGVQRGTDVVKALCLGARAVGLGRAPLWGLGVGGRDGVARVFEILKAEVETCMRLLGVERIDQLGMQHINARAVERDIYDGPMGLEKIGLWVQAAKARL